MRAVLLLLCCFLYFSAVSSVELSSRKALKKFRILGLFGHPGKSHFDVFKPLLEELAHRGHDLTVVSFFPRDNRTTPLQNYRDIDLSEGRGIFVNVMDLNKIHHSIFTIYMEQLFLRQWALKYCQESFNVAGVKKLIASNEKFDLIVTEAFNSDCFFAFAHKFPAPIILLSSHVMMPWFNLFSNPENPSYVPAIYHGFSRHMTLSERVINTINYEILKFMYTVSVSWQQQSIVENAFGYKIPPLRQIAHNVSAILVNTHYSLHGAKPNVPSVIEIGGLHMNPSPKLPADLKKILDDASEGVLFFSWGSMIRTTSIPSEKLQDIVTVIGSIPRTVIWKWEDDNLPNKPGNVIIRKWLPQAAILRHPNVKCYLAHGGLLGISEGASAGVPMVVVPMYGDQFNNAAAARDRGVAVVVEWSTLNANILRSAIDTVFNDSSYQRNAKLLQKHYNDRPATALETAVWWTEYVARNGGQFLNSPAKSLAWYQVALIDVALAIGLIACLVFYITYKAGKCLIRWIYTRVLDNDNSAKKHV